MATCKIVPSPSISPTAYRLYGIHHSGAIRDGSTHSKDYFTSNYRQFLSRAHRDWCSGLFNGTYELVRKV